jgi:rhodanese-related sulfurtransferase
LATTAIGDAPTVPKLVNVERALRLMRRRAQLVDVLPNSVYVEEHLPDAINVALETLDESAVDGLERDRALLVYCFDQH